MYTFLGLIAVIIITVACNVLKIHIAISLLLSWLIGFAIGVQKGEKMVDIYKSKINQELSEK